MDVSANGAGILVVDDTLENLRLLAGMLAEHGYDVRPVTSGRQALQAAQHEPPELILLDVSMPEMDGYQVCEQLRASPALRDVPVIFLTALSDTASKVKGFDVGGSDYITKPFQIEEVIARVKTHLGLRRAQLELQRQYQQLRSLEQLRDDLVHMVVHDMRSPLSAMLTLIDLVLTEAGAVLGPQSLDDLRTASQAASGLNRMTNDLLDVSRMEEGKLPLERAAHDLVTIANDVRAALSSLDRSRVIEILTEGPAVASCDRSIVRRVLENLVSNAIKHTPTGGRIAISVQRLGHGVRVAVQDEGPGVPPQARSKIFEKFGTLTSRNERAFHSVGLGLAFSKLAVTAHGGSIGVDDAQPRGSSFWFELPS